MKPDTILEAARNSARTEETRRRLEEISRAPGYAEPGYEDPKEKKGVYLGDWNAPDFYDPVQRCRVDYPDGHLLPRLKEALEKAGAKTEWDGEWASCHDCGRIARTIPDWSGWRPILIYNLSKGSCLCRDCYADGASMKVLWKGTLAFAKGHLAFTGHGEEFEAEIVDGPEGPTILKHKDSGVEEILPHRIENEYLLKAVAEAAKNVAQSETNFTAPQERSKHLKDVATSFKTHVVAHESSPIHGQQHAFWDQEDLMNDYDAKNKARIQALLSLIMTVLEGSPKNYSSNTTFAHTGSVLDWIFAHRAAIRRFNVGVISSQNNNVAWDVPSPGGEILEILLKHLDRLESDTRAKLLQMLDAVQK